MISNEQEIQGLVLSSGHPIQHPSEALKGSQGQHENIFRPHSSLRVQGQTTYGIADENATLRVESTPTPCVRQLVAKIKVSCIGKPYEKANRKPMKKRCDKRVERRINPRWACQSGKELEHCALEYILRKEILHLFLNAFGCSQLYCSFLLSSHVGCRLSIIGPYSIKQRQRREVTMRSSKKSKTIHGSSMT